MTIKTESSVVEYVDLVNEIYDALQNIKEFAASLPAPDENGVLVNMDYGHLGTIKHIHSLLGEVAQATDEMYAR